MGSPSFGYGDGEAKVFRTNGGQRTRNVPERPRSPGKIWEGQLILTLDGGGVRGYSSLLILRALIKEIAGLERTLEPRAANSECSPLFQPSITEDVDELDPSNNEPWGHERRSEDSYLLCHYFDYICGTSTGGITAIMLGNMRLTVSETMDRCRAVWRGMAPGYHTKLLKSFGSLPSKAKNSSRIRERLRRALASTNAYDDGELGQQEHQTSKAVLNFASTTMEANSGNCQTIVFAMHNASRGVMCPYTIRSYSHFACSDPLVRNPNKDTRTMSMVDACRATSAAPNYFEKVKIEGYEGSFVDGSLWRTNPAGEVYREVHDLHTGSRAPIKGLLSVGYSSPRRRGSQDDTQPASTALEKPPRDETDEMLRARQRVENFEYGRLVYPSIDGESGDLDKWFDRLTREAERYCKTEPFRTQIAYWAKFLVATRRQRAQTVHWETYAGLQLSCPLCSNDDVLLDREALLVHVKVEHNISARGLHTQVNAPTKTDDDHVRRHTLR